MVRSMARRLDAFPGEPASGRRRYPWHEWTDGATWEIRRGDDYDVATENMRVNLHMKAESLTRKVRTRKIRDDQGEGLIFQFLESETAAMKNATAGSVHAMDQTMASLYADALEIYERARREVTIRRSDGSEQRYAAVRYKQQIDKAYTEGELVAAIGRIVRRRTQGFGHLEKARRPDLMVETLVLDTSKPYHRLFPTAAIQAAGERMAQYAARHPQ